MGVTRVLARPKHSTVFLRFICVTLVIFPIGCGGSITQPPSVQAAGAKSARTTSAEAAPNSGSGSNPVDQNGNDWPQYRRDPQNSGNNPYQTAITEANVGSL